MNRYYVTKWVLSRGIIKISDAQFEKHFYISTGGAGAPYLSGHCLGPGEFYDWFLAPRDYTPSLDVAKQRAGMLLEKKRASLLKQLEKLSAKTIKVVDLEEPK